MKLIFSTGNYSKNINVMLLLLRVMVGVLMLTHGYGKVQKFFGEEPIRFSDPLGVGVTTSLGLAMFSEFFCSILIIFGAFTRFAAMVLLTTMLVAALIVHANDGFGKQELPLLYATIYVAIIIGGAGKISIDNWMEKKLKSK